MGGASGDISGELGVAPGKVGMVSMVSMVSQLYDIGSLLVMACCKNDVYIQAVLDSIMLIIYTMQ